MWGTVNTCRQVESQAPGTVVPIGDDTKEPLDGSKEPGPHLPEGGDKLIIITFL